MSDMESHVLGTYLHLACMTLLASLPVKPGLLLGDQDVTLPSIWLIRCSRRPTV